MKNNFFYKLTLVILILSNPIILYSNELDIKSQNIKPQNIICHRETNKIKFIDFGASVQLTGKYEDVEEGMGTEGYMSQELKFGIAYHKSDISSLGVSLLELWTTDLWYLTATYRKDILFGIKQVEKRNTALANIIRKCVSPNISQRPTIHTLIDKLAAIVET